VKGHYRAEVDDLLDLVGYTWTSEGKVIGQGPEGDRGFDTLLSGKSHLRHVGVTATDSNGMIVNQTRKVSISTSRTRTRAAPRIIVLSRVGGMSACRPGRSLAIVEIQMPPADTDEGLVAARHIREHYPQASSPC
jgi:hypothetical protein